MDYFWRLNKMKNKQNLNKNIKFREENEQMNKLTREDYKNMEKKMRNILIKSLNYYRNAMIEKHQLLKNNTHN